MGGGGRSGGRGGASKLPVAHHIRTKVAVRRGVWERVCVWGGGGHGGSLFRVGRGGDQESEGPE